MRALLTLSLVLLSFAPNAFALDPMPTPVQLDRVETAKVCMVNNQIFAKDQIPVEVEGKTYYGCCEMCKATLKNDINARMAVDPISKRPVDKAEAVIGAAKDGSVFYFENEENLAKFGN